VADEKEFDSELINVKRYVDPFNPIDNNPYRLLACSACGSIGHNCNCTDFTGA
jgi:hypothetical protein